MTGLFGGVMAAALMHDALHLSDLMAFANVLWAGPLVGALASIPIRGMARKNVAEELATRRGAFTAITDAVQQHVAPPVRARVEVAASEDEIEADLASASPRAEPR